MCARRVLDLCLCTDETNMKLYRSYGKVKMWKCAYSLVCKAWWRWLSWHACMAVSGTGPLNFTDDLMYDDSSRMNLEGYKTILPTKFKIKPPD